MKLYYTENNTSIHVLRPLTATPTYWISPTRSHFIRSKIIVLNYCS